MYYATCFTPLRWRKKKGKLIPTHKLKPSPNKVISDVQPAEQSTAPEVSVQKEKVLPPTEIPAPKPEIKIEPIQANQISSMSLSSIKRKKDWEKQQKPKEEVKEHPTEEFSEASLVEFWNQYQQMKFEKGDQNIASLLKISKPKLVDKTTVHFNVPSDLNKVELEREFTKFVPYLRSNLKNFDLAVKVIVDEQTEKNFIYTPDEKYERLKEINPAVELLRKEFDLDV